MAATSTTISAAMGLNDQYVSLTSATGLVAGMALKIDDEYMMVHPDQTAATNPCHVYRRGDRGSVVVAHNALAVCWFGLPSDLAALGPGTTIQDARTPLGWQLASYSVSGAIAVPTVDTIVVLNKAGVAAMTLAAPGKDQDGLQLLITSTTAQAHTITATSLIADGASGSPHTTITFTTGYKGQGCTLTALQGLWQLTSNVATTIT